MMIPTTPMIIFLIKRSDGSYSDYVTENMKAFRSLEDAEKFIKDTQQQIDEIRIIVDRLERQKSSIQEEFLKKFPRPKQDHNEIFVKWCQELDKYCNSVILESSVYKELSGLPYIKTYQLEALNKHYSGQRDSRIDELLVNMQWDYDIEEIELI